MDNDNSRNNEGISYYSFIIVFPILPYIIEYYYVVQFMYYINPNKRVLLYYPIPCISIQIIIKFCAFVTSILRKEESSLLVDSTEASPAANYMQIIAHIHTISLILHLHSSSIWG